jgi:ribosomal protein S18 acetylase RimI-like enzyme
LPEEHASPKLFFEPLGSQHDRAAFSCESTKLEAYLKHQARQDVEKRLAAAFVLTPDGKTIAGYYTLSQYSIQLDTIPESIASKLTKHPLVPTTLIGRLARSTAFAGRGVGELLLMDALHRSLAHSREIASWAVVVDAKDEKAVSFYRKYGFIEIPKVSHRLFLPMRTVEAMFR